MIPSNLPATKLLQPGWAGELSPEEYSIIKSELKKSQHLKRRWGFRPTARRISEKRIREIATDGPNQKHRSVSASVENPKISSDT